MSPKSWLKWVPSWFLGNFLWELFKLLKEYSPVSIMIGIATYVLSIATLSIEVLEKIPPLAISFAVVFLFTIYIVMRYSYSHVVKYHTLRSGSGIFHYSRNTAVMHQKENEELLLEKIETAVKIDIIGATGFNTFSRKDGDSTAVLRDAFEKTTADIRILLLEPGENQTVDRAKSLDVPIDKYNTEIEESIRFIKWLKVTKGKKIELKFYRWNLIWKMIIIDDFLWLQHYQSGKHVAGMPVYGILRNEKEDVSNLFVPLSEVFYKKWNYKGNPEFDFDTNEIVRLSSGIKTKIDL